MPGVLGSVRNETRELGPVSTAGEMLIVPALLNRRLVLPATRDLLAKLRFAGWPAGYIADCVERWEKLDADY